jgi:hypothetical protein
MQSCGDHFESSNTCSVQFPYRRNPTVRTSISRNAYFFLLPLVGLNPQTTRYLIGIRIVCSALASSACCPLSMFRVGQVIPELVCLDIKLDFLPRRTWKNHRSE